MKHVGPNLGGIGIPTLVPVSVDLPANCGKPMPVHGAPIEDRGMRLAETLVRTEMGRGCHVSAGQLRILYALVAREGFRHFGPDLDEPCFEV
jgi:hypothetical protein